MNIVVSDSRRRRPEDYPGVRICPKCSADSGNVRRGPANMRRGPERQASTDRPPWGFIVADCGRSAVAVIPRSNQKVNAGRRQSEIKIQEWEAVRAELKQKTIHAKNVWRHANKSFSNKKPD